jgi:AraC-like DNA-binding protein/quercetin dioxygenase-like cupin family protein
MDINLLNTLSPFVRAVKIAKSSSLAGEWIDYDHVFTYIEQGTAVFVLDGASYSVAEGDVVLMPPHMTHIIRSTSELPLIQYIFHFDCQFSVQRSQWTELGSAGGLQSAVPPSEQIFGGYAPVVHIRPSDRLELAKTFLAMQKEHMEQRLVHSLMLKAGALTLLALYLRNLDGRSAIKAQASSGWPIIEKCITIMQEQFADPALNNKSISDQAGVSTSHMIYLFHQELGITVHKYLTYVRTRQAKRKILERTHSLTQVAEQTGFSSIHHFSRTFKAMAGMTASQFLAAHNPAIPVLTNRKGEQWDEQADESSDK